MHNCSCSQLSLIGLLAVCGAFQSLEEGFRIRAEQGSEDYENIKSLAPVVRFALACSALHCWL